ncbi:hypothetical protein G7Z17_g12773 [Cylindrodendrum hubeiense]|uniref:SUI1 domain-containing protein n=1 Tax=Cylindrodendrum hubeiense TaxID=595255 RepID=A0A9P5GXP1_9HYPO|nr:hypothetical protein G7Z17_g12773 [Cylindrodendrum hubeiense]
MVDSGGRRPKRTTRGCGLTSEAPIPCSLPPPTKRRPHAAPPLNPLSLLFPSLLNPSKVKKKPSSLASSTAHHSVANQLQPNSSLSSCRKALRSPPFKPLRSVAQTPALPNSEFMSIENLKTYDPFAEADEDTGETKQTQSYIHIRIQQRNGRKTLTTVQGLPKKFDQKKILKVIKKKFACNGTIVTDTEMGEVIQLQGDQRKDVQEFLIDKKEGLELDAKTIKVHGF